MEENDFYPYEEEIITILRRFDKNDDGRWSFDEFRDAISPRYFNSLDVNKASLAPDNIKQS